MRTVIALICYGFLSVVSLDARAETEFQTVQTAKRIRPDYDGRGEDPKTAKDVLIWAPKVIFFPAHLVTEYVIRKPLGWLLSTAEKNHWHTHLLDTFTFGENRQALLIPTFFLEFNFKPSIGFFIKWKRFLSDENTLRFRAAYGGTNRYVLKFGDEYQLSNVDLLALSAKLEERDDHNFYGLGPNTQKQDRSRYFARKVELDLGYTRQLSDTSHIKTVVGIRSASFGNGDSGGDPGIVDLISNGTFNAPPGFNSGFTAFTQGVELAIGHRLVRPKRPFGGRTEFHFEHAIDLRSSDTLRWIKYGGTLTGFVSLFNNDRNLSLRLDLDFADDIGSGEVPFTELAHLGGDKLLPGFRSGRLVGNSLFALTLGYRWPIWSWLDGTLHYAVGNVFGERLSGFKLGDLRQSIDIGMQTPLGPPAEFGLSLAWGSKKFSKGGAFNEFRVVFTTSHSF